MMKMAQPWAYLWLLPGNLHEVIQVEGAGDNELAELPIMFFIVVGELLAKGMATTCS
jgi:hypothetical protein